MIDQQPSCMIDQQPSQDTRNGHVNTAMDVVEELLKEENMERMVAEALASINWDDNANTNSTHL